ncbi:hypothetical protein BDV96DRAFT_642160 [Lophiotrema nucula]|uniref:Uncharacterized protein n=1 Tax=Lophiotrema nucula TaxID=690887 RepID=A0A6A5ZM24_9PLEO|nr:hypothetical protein BDV96DRAFT_642160 [Lophiotrema nucula]
MLIDFLTFVAVNPHAAMAQHFANRKRKKALKPPRLAESLPDSPLNPVTCFNLCRNKEPPHSHLLKCGHFIETLRKDEECGVNCMNYASPRSSKLHSLKALASKSPPSPFLCRPCVAEEVEKEYESWIGELSPYGIISRTPMKNDDSAAYGQFQLEIGFSNVFLGRMTLEEVANLEAERRLSAFGLRDVKVPLSESMADGERRTVEGCVTVETEVVVTEGLGEVIRRLERWKMDREGVGWDGDREFAVATGVLDGLLHG